MKIVLNVQTLERLIGGDTEIEVELRKNIVHEFSKRHLSAVAKEVMGDVTTAKEAIFTQVLAGMGAVKIATWGDERFRLSTEARDIIKVQIKQAIVETVNATVKEVWAEMRPQILEALKACYDRESLKELKAQVKEDVLKSLKDS